MKVKLLVNADQQEFQDKINKFIDSKKVVDIKFSEWEVEGAAGYSALILYEEEKFP